MKINKSKKLLASIMAISLVSMYPLQALALTKEENVYATLDYTGNTTKTVVTSHLTSVGSNDVQDETLLKDILNVNGNESFSLSDNKLTWKGENKDIFYQGTTTKNLPVTVKVKYYLNNELVDAKDIVGKSGSIKMVLSFTNNEYQKVTVNGKSVGLYTPFVSTVGMMVDGKTTSNVSIDNGKVVSTGTKNMVVGIASPGLYKSLELNELKSLDQLTITYDTTDFKINSMYVVTTAELLSETNLEVFNKMDKLSDSMTELQENMDKIEAGANKLTAGSNAILSSLETSMNEMKTKVENKKVIDDKTMSTIKESAVSAVDNSIGDGSSIALQAITKSIQTLTANKTTLENGLTALKDSYNTQFVPAYNSAYSQNLSTVSNVKEFAELVNSDNTVINSFLSSAASQASNGNTSLIPTIIAQYKTYCSQYTNISNTLDQLKDTNSITYKTMYSALSGTAVTVAESTASSVSETVAESVAESVATTSLNSLNNLQNAISELAQGLETLTDGIEQFNDKGINTLTNYASIASDYAAKTEELVKLSKNYKGFGSNNSDSTTLIYLIKK